MYLKAHLGVLSCHPVITLVQVAVTLSPPSHPVSLSKDEPTSMRDFSVYALHVHSVGIEGIRDCAQPARFTCTICQASFASSRGLAEHLVRYRLHLK